MCKHWPAQSGREGDKIIKLHLLVILIRPYSRQKVNRDWKMRQMYAFGSQCYTEIIITALM